MADAGERQLGDQRAGDQPITTTTTSPREGERLEVSTTPGAFAASRTYNPDPSLSEQERAAGLQEAGTLPGGGQYRVQASTHSYRMEQVQGDPGSSEQ